MARLECIANTLTIWRSFGSKIYEKRIALRPGQVFDETIRLSGDADEKEIRTGAGASRHWRVGLVPSPGQSNRNRMDGSNATGLSLRARGAGYHRAL